MNCHEFHEGYVVLLDPESAETAARAELAEHLKACPSCAQFYDEITRTVALLRPSTEVHASPQFKGNVMNKIMQEEKIGRPPTQAREPKRKKTWQFALAAGIAGLLACSALLWVKSHSAGNVVAELSAFSLFREASAAEESLFKGDGIVSIVNEFIVKPISDPELARIRRYPMYSLAPSGKLRYDHLALPAKPGEGYTVKDRAWFEPKTGRFVRVMTVGQNPIFANSYDGKAVYRLEPDAAGVLRVVGKPITEDFQTPKNPAAFLGQTAMMEPLTDEKDYSKYLTDAGQVTLPDGSAARVIKFRMDDVPINMPGNLTSTREFKEGMRGSYALFTIRKSDNAIAECELFLQGQLLFVMRRVANGTVATTAVPWNLGGIADQADGTQAPATPRVTPDGEIYLEADSVEQMVAKAGYQTYIFSSDPSWVAERHLVGIPGGHDNGIDFKPIFTITYCAKSGRHVVLIQTQEKNEPQKNEPLKKNGKPVYTSPKGFKVWSLPPKAVQAMSKMLFTSMWFKDPPAENSTCCLVETPAGTSVTLAINGPVTEDELHALIDSLIPAEEYVKKFPAPAPVVQPTPTGTAIRPARRGEWFRPAISQDTVPQDVSVQHMADYVVVHTYVFAVAPSWTSERHIADLPDPDTEPLRMFMIAYRAKDGRHIVLLQAVNYGRTLGMLVEGRIAEKFNPKFAAVYTSPAGFKVWRIPNSFTVSGLLPQDARAWIKDPPPVVYVVKTPGGTFAALAVNGALTDDELHALIDSLIPAKEYMKEFPEPAAAGVERTGTTSP